MKTIHWLVLGILICALPHSAGAATIDRFTLGGSSTYSVGDQFYLFGTAEEYFLSDGTSWSSGAGSKFAAKGVLQSIEIKGDVIKYTFMPPDDGILFRQTDYDAGGHSAQGELGAAESLIILEAAANATTGMMTGYVKIVSNEETYYGEPRFNYFSAGVGELVKYRITCTLSGAVWTENTFESSFSYSLNGVVDFTRTGRGDVNRDGDIDVQDAAAAMQLVSDNLPNTPVYVSGDVNDDGKIGAAEAIYALRWAAGLYNRAPVLAGIGAKSVDENSPLVFTVSAADPDLDALSYTASGLPPGASFDPDGKEFSWTPTYAQSGAYAVTFVVEDRYGASDFETVTITVNDVPVFSSPDYFPLTVGNWWGYKEDSTGVIRRTSVEETKRIGSVLAQVLQYPDGSKEYYTSDDEGLMLYGEYAISDEYTGEVIFDDPILLMANHGTLGTVQVSTTSYILEVYGNPYHVNLTSTVEIENIEAVITENQTLTDCIKVSVRLSQEIVEIGQTIEAQRFIWVHKGVGVVKQAEDAESFTITESFVDGEHLQY